MPPASLRSVAAIIAVASAFSAAAEPARAVPVLDQHFDSNVPPTPNTAGGQVNAQTFTVGADGLLTSVELLVMKDQVVSTASLTVEIRALTGGVIDSNPSPVSATRQSAEISGSWSFVSFDLSSANFQVTAGQTLAIVALESQDRFALGLTTSGTYAGGSRWFNNGSWVNRTAHDMYFRTFVDANPGGENHVPEPATVALITATGPAAWSRGRPR